MRQIVLFLVFLIVWQGLGYFFGGDDYAFMKELPMSILMAVFFVFADYTLSKVRENKQS